MITSRTQPPVKIGKMPVSNTSISMLQCSLWVAMNVKDSSSLLWVRVKRTTECQRIFRIWSCSNQSRQTSARRHGCSPGTTRMPSQQLSSPGFVWFRSSVMLLSGNRLDLVDWLNLFQKNTGLQKCSWGEHLLPGRSTWCFEHKYNTYWRMRSRKRSWNHPSTSLQ